VEGLVDSPERKEQLLKALAPFTHDPAVKIQIAHAAEAAVSQTNPVRIVVQGVDTFANKIPADAELRSHFGKTVRAADLDDTVRDYASRTVEHAVQVRFQALALLRLVQRFNAAQLKAMQPDARATWHRLVNQHAQLVLQDLRALRGELQPVFGSSWGTDAGSDAPTGEDALSSAAARLLSLSTAVDDAVGQSLLLSSADAQPTAIKTSQFSSSLAQAERLAHYIFARTQP
jgi:hypothetical protein